LLHNEQKKAIAATSDRPNHDMSLSPHTRRWRCARQAPQIVIHVIQTQKTNETAKRRRTTTFQRSDTGLEDVKMIARHRS
jgi:hypothetical protein